YGHGNVSPCGHDPATTGLTTIPERPTGPRPGVPPPDTGSICTHRLATPAGALPRPGHAPHPRLRRRHLAHDRPRGPTTPPPGACRRHTGTGHIFWLEPLQGRRGPTR